MDDLQNDALICIFSMAFGSYIVETMKFVL